MILTFLDLRWPGGLAESCWETPFDSIAPEQANGSRPADAAGHHSSFLSTNCPGMRKNEVHTEPGRRESGTLPHRRYGEGIT